MAFPQYFRRFAGALLIAAMVGTPASSRAAVHLPVPYMAQPDNQTCLPTSLMMALNFMGRIDMFSSDTVQLLHKTCQYNRFNTPDLVRQFGVYALPNWHNLGWTTETVKAQLDLGRPVVVGVNHGRAGHFMLAIGYTDDGNVIVHDPSPKSAGDPIGGPDCVAEWKDMLWRGGVIVSPEPFPEPPPVSGVALGEDGLPLEFPHPVYVTSGEDAEVSFTLKNNGRVAWPANTMLAPVDVNSSPTATSSSVLMPDQGWQGKTVVGQGLPGLEPETTGVITFRVKAPKVDKPTTFLEYYNLREGEGRWFSSSWLAGPGNRNMGVRMIVYPAGDAPKLPMIETGSNGKPDLPWEAKFSSVAVDAQTSAPLSGDAVLSLPSSETGFNSAFVGDYRWKDYRVETWVFCELQKERKKEGWRRVGLFARDNGQHMGDTKNEAEIGSCIAMTFDSDDGLIRAGNVANGGIDVFKREKFFVPETGWHKFAITCKGNTVTYELDDKPFHVQNRVRQYPQGDCGVYYRSAYPTGTDVDPMHFAGFKVTDTK